MTINSLRKVPNVVHLSRIHSMMLPDFIPILWFDDLFVFIVDLFYLPLNSSFGGETVGHVLSLEEKLEYRSYLALILVPHWIGDERLSSIYTNSSHTYCYECWAMATSPHTRAPRTKPGRPECGWRASTTCGHECNSIQRLVRLATFFWFFIFYFYLKILLRFSGRVGPVQENRICML